MRTSFFLSFLYFFQVADSMSDCGRRGPPPGRSQAGISGRSWDVLLLVLRAGPCYGARLRPRKLGRNLDNPLSGLVEYQRRMDLESFSPRANPSHAVARHPSPAPLLERASQGWMTPTRQGFVNQVNDVLSSAKFQGR
jgi:hypothetical protein